MLEPQIPVQSGAFGRVLLHHEQRRLCTGAWVLPFPEMKARGANPGDLVALLSATGAQTETIPPSLVLITIGSVTGVSIAALFTGGMLPAAVLAVALGAVVWRRYRGEISHVRRPGAREIGRSLLIALPALALPFVIRAAVIGGVATATEVSTLGIAVPRSLPGS